MGRPSLEVVDVGFASIPRGQRASRGAAAGAYSQGDFGTAPRTQRTSRAASVYSGEVGTVERVMMLEDTRTMGLGKFNKKALQRAEKLSRCTKKCAGKPKKCVDDCMAKAKAKGLSTTAKVVGGGVTASLLALLFL